MTNIAPTADQLLSVVESALDDEIDMILDQVSRDDYTPSEKAALVALLRLPWQRHQQQTSPSRAATLTVLPGCRTESADR